MELEEYEYNDKPRGEDDFELEDIDDDEDEGFYSHLSKTIAYTWHEFPAEEYRIDQQAESNCQLGSLENVMLRPKLVRRPSFVGTLFSACSSLNTLIVSV